MNLKVFLETWTIKLTQYVSYLSVFFFVWKHCVSTLKLLCFCRRHLGVSFYTVVPLAAVGVDSAQVGSLSSMMHSFHFHCLLKTWNIKRNVEYATTSQFSNYGWVKPLFFYILFFNFAKQIDCFTKCFI